MPETELLQQLGAWGAGILALLGSGAVLRRRLSRDAAEMARDKVEIAKGKVEISILQNLLAEREAAMIRARERALLYEKAIEMVARFETQTKFLEAAMTRREDEFGSFKRKIARMYPETRVMVESDFMPLPESNGP